MGVGSLVGRSTCVGVGVDGLIGVAAGSTSSEPKKITWVGVGTAVGGTCEGSVRTQGTD